MPLNGQIPLLLTGRHIPQFVVILLRNNHTNRLLIPHPLTIETLKFLILAGTVDDGFVDWAAGRRLRFGWFVVSTVLGVGGAGLLLFRRLGGGGLALGLHFVGVVVRTGGYGLVEKEGAVGAGGV